MHIKIKSEENDNTNVVEKENKKQEPVIIDTRRSEAVDVNIDRPTPPFWGTKILKPEDLDLDELFWYLDLQALFAGQWQFRKHQGQPREEYNEFLGIIKKQIPY